jgi:diguanylate cyclase (GGDEF)-like protein
VTGAAERDTRDRDGLTFVLMALGGLAGALAWLAGRPGHEAAGNLGGTLALTAAALACRRISRITGDDPQVRGFWRLWSYSCGVLALSTISAVVRTGIGRPGLLLYEMIPTLLSLNLATAAFRHVPLTRRTTTDWIRLALDGLGVAVAGVVFFGYVVVDLVPPTTPVAARWAAAVVGVGCLLALVVFGKAAVNPEGRVDPGALGIMAAASVVGMVAVVLYLGGTPMGMTLLSLVGYPLVGLAICGAAYRQGRVHLARTGDAGRTRHRSIADVAQYLAVAVIAVLVITVSTRDLSGRGQAVVVGAVLIAAILVARQLLSLRENQVALRGIRHQQAELERLALSDALTGLPSRTGFGLALSERLESSLAATALMIDIDDFKNINDTLGPSAADRLLHQVGRLLREACGPDEMAARLGGDEFAVLLPIDDPASVERAASRFQLAVSQPVRASDQQLLLHASVGVAVAAAGETADEVLRNADIAMYAAKESGKASWVRFEPRMRQDMVDHARVAGELHEALVRGGELRLYYQPVHDLETGRLEGAEALVRWQHPTRGFVSPADFVPVAERSGLIVPLGAWVLREACRQLADWDGAIEAINVNVAVRQLREASFVDEVAAILAETGLTSRNLVLEVTESSVVDGRQVQETLQALHEMGVRLALDDFGTGQSSLSLLRAFPVDVLKLDKSFVDGVADGADRGLVAVAAAVAQLASHLGLKAVAEGIESEAQRERLREMGYRYGQGFLMGKPMPPEELLAGFDRSFGGLAAEAAPRN